MNIFIEAYAIAHPYVGIGEFCLHLCEHLAGHARRLREQYGVQLYFIVPEGCKGIWGNEVHYVTFPGDVSLLSRCYGKHIDLLHLPHQYCRFKHFPRVGHTLMTVHDINFMYEKQGSKLEKYKKKFRAKLCQADYISYISQFTKSDTEANFQVSHPSRVIYNGVSKVEADTVAVSDDFADRLPQRPFLFHISSLRPKKNVHLLIEMMVYLPDEVLVVAGDWSGRYGSEMQERIRQLGLTNVVCLDNVSTEEKIWLYDHCRAFLFPSQCEGFGLPPVEAMYYGKPVFLSELTSLPEVGGEHAFYWPELEPEQMAAVVRERLHDADSHPELPAQLKTSTDRFDWEQCAEEYVRYYLDILQLQQGGRTILQMSSNKQWGGGEQYIKDLSLRLREDGEDVRIVCRRRCNAISRWQTTGLPLMPLPLRGKIDLWSPWKLSRVIRQGAVIIHVHNFKDATMAAVARLWSGNKAGVRIIVTRHLVKRGGTHFGHRWLYRQLGRVVFVSELAKRVFLSSLPTIDPAKLTVVSNSIRLQDGEPADVRREFGIAPHVPIIMYHGRLTADKGVDVLIDALPRLKNRSFFLLLLGDGKASYVKRLRQRLTAYGLDRQVGFAGFRPQVAPYIRQCLFGVTPSVVKESFQLAALEYMSLGKCVITTGHGGQKEYIESGRNGLLVAPGDSGALAEVMDRLLGDEALCRRYGSEAAHDFAAHHDYETFYQQIKENYRLLYEA